MVPSFVNGAIAPTFTCFHENETLDDAGQREFLDFLLESGAISAFFIRSGMGQMFAFQFDEVKQLLKNACSHLQGRAPVLAGTIGIWDRNPERRPDPAVFMKQAIELSKYAESIGAAGVVHTVPEAIAPQGSETHADVILRYVEAISNAVSCPVFVYQPPGVMPEYRIAPELLAQLADFPNVYGIKVSTNDAELLFDMAWAVREKDFAMIAGSETSYFSALGLGIRSVIGQGSCVNPQIIRACQERFEQGDMAGAMQAQHSINHLVKTSVQTVEFLKRYAADKGYDVKPFARSLPGNPYYRLGPPLTNEAYETYKSILERELARFGAVGAASV